jgi:hypothetical protein
MKAAPIDHCPRSAHAVEPELHTAGLSRYLTYSMKSAFHSPPDLRRLTMAGMSDGLMPSLGC